MAWSRESRQARGYGRAWELVRDVAMNRDCGLCQVCRRAGTATAATEVDHIIGKAKGGTDELSNLQAICRSCHKAKTMADEGYKVRPAVGADGWPVACL